MGALLLRIITLSLILISFSCKIYAQSNWEAGVRYGDGAAMDATIPLSNSPRAHGAIYLGNNYGMGFGLGGYFNWLFGFSGDHTGFKIYPGIGAEMYFGDDFEVGIAGDFGIEYSFNFPVTLAFDWRPGIMISEKMEYYNDNNWGFIARYRFGKGTKFKK